MTRPRASFWMLLAMLLVAVGGCKPFAFVRTFSFSSASSYLEAAEELSRQGKTEEAIAEYRQHIAFRLAVEDRPEWENPYFYLLLIGDLQLNAGQLDAALTTYEEAERQKVHPSLISDRFRSVATWYESQGKLVEAATILERYRTRDELLFDSMLDRISKQIVQKEEAAAALATASPTPSPVSPTLPESESLVQ